MILISTIMFWFLVLKNKKTCFLSCITIYMSYHHVVCWHQIRKAKTLTSWTCNHFHASYIFNQCFFWRNQSTKIILSFLKLRIIFKVLYILWAQFRTGPPSPVSYWPVKPSFVWPTKPSFVLAHQAQFHTGPPSPVSY